MPVKGRIDLFVPHMILQRPSGGPRAGGHQEGELGGPHHNDQEHHQIHVWHHFQNGITYAIQIDYREHLKQVDIKKDNWEDLIMMTKNIVKYMCGTIFKMALDMPLK